MGYMHINNLHSDPRIFMFRECYALEKVHGTSAHISWDGTVLRFSPGSESHSAFVSTVLRERAIRLSIFRNDHGAITLDAFGEAGRFALGEALREIGNGRAITVYGEAYGGRCMGMRATYGNTLRFIVFDVRIADHWLTVPRAAHVAEELGLEFVPHRVVNTTTSALNAERDRPSEVAVRRGCGDDRPREGVVLRPLIELLTPTGERIIAKHKTAAFAERAHPPDANPPDARSADPARLAVLADADAIAQEWVVPMRLTHVLDKLPKGGVEITGAVVKAIVEDVLREAAGEIVGTKDVTKAIGRRAAQLFHERLAANLDHAHGRKNESP